LERGEVKIQISKSKIRRNSKHQAPIPMMSASEKDTLLWWLIPGVLAGMPMPFVHAERRLAGGGALHDFADELPALDAAGIRAVVSLLNIPSDATVFESAGFAFLCLPVPDGGAPTMSQMDEFIQFVAGQIIRQRPVAVHCEAGLGRTGTMLAAFLISQGDSAARAIAKVRAVESSAIETSRQIQFLEQYAGRLRANSV
jgi:atypical dual specificity phosphatase